MYVNHGKGKFDIRAHKTELRRRFKKVRTDMPAELKKIRDENIFARLVATQAYKNAKTVLTYVSTPIEVDTRALIERALADGKTVAVPRCVDGTRDMIFYVINSFEQLEEGMFSVMEPMPEKCAELTDFSEAVCIVPALVYDKDGYRLGYGKGYYDRFLSAHNGLYSIGICYCCCTVPKLLRGRFDKAADMLVTEKYVNKIGGNTFGA